MATFAPSRAARSAIARPMPRLPPVMNMVRPSRLMRAESRVPAVSAAFVVDAVRTPFGRYGGALAGVRPDDLAAVAVRALLDRSPGLDVEAIEDVVFGEANGAGEDNRNVARMGVHPAGVPTPNPGVTADRLRSASVE